MTSKALSLYPWAMGNDWHHSRAFVLELGPQADPAGGRMEGRIEHVASLRSARFGSLVELVAFLIEVLAEGNAARIEENGEA
jgi:hypothetical protein